MTSRLSRLRLIAVIVVLSTSTGCVATHEVPLVDVANEFRLVRVTLADETYVRVFHPTIVGDTLHGYTSRLSSRTSASYRESVAIGIPMSEISKVEVQRTRPVLTAIAIGGLAGGLLIGQVIFWVLVMLLTDTTEF